MKIQSLQFTADHKDKKPLRCNLDVSDSESLTKLKQNIEFPIAYLICSNDLSRLKEEFRDAIIDRGIKKPHIELGRCFKKELNDKVQIIEAAYNAPGSAKKSISAFLFKTRDLLNAYIIGAKKDIFDDLWRDGEEPGKRNTQEKGSKTRKSYPDIDDADELMCELYEELIKRCNVPKDLEEKYVGKSLKVDLVRRLIVLAAKKDMPVLILGDTGTGKEVVAQQIHTLYKKTKNKSGKVITLNCSAFPADLLEMELFGVEPDVGIYCGPRGKPKIGLWEVANEGTLFLDEIGDIDPRHQAKILRALENNVIRRVGGTCDIPVNARIVAATNHNLAWMVQTGRFREDLYYRLRGFLIHTPALKDHIEDIPLLAEFFWQKIRGNEGNNQTWVKNILPPVVMDQLQLYRWPGNARELRSILIRLDSLCEGREITVKDLKHAFTIEGQNWTTQSLDMSERGIDLIRGDCWRHLKRVDDVVRAARFDIEPIIDNKKDAKKKAAAMLNYLEYHLGELKILCREHFLFHSPETFSAVSRFTDRLQKFHDLLHDNPSKAKERWKETLAEEFEEVLSVIFREGARVLG